MVLVYEVLVRRHSEYLGQWHGRAEYEGRATQ